MKLGVILASVTVTVAIALGAGSYWLNNNQSQAVNPSNIEVSDFENRVFKSLALNNGLKVVLVSDPESDQAAAALNVFTGSWANPADAQGMAHFLEHMLFLGTEKFPKIDAYQSFIEQNGGSNNAYTSAENTLYFFDINAPKFEQGIDRFSQFFIAPLFDPEFSERERNAVHSEFSASLQNDARRIEDVVRELTSPAHPASRLAIGNLDTLKSENISARLNQFFRTHYVAGNMALTLYGPQDIDSLEALAKQYFSGIRATEVVPTVYSQPLFNANDLPLLAEIKPRKEIRRLEFRFPLINSAENLTNKPYDYVGHLLGHESSGSLLAALKQKGWAENLGAGIAALTPSSTTFNVSIELTPDGLTQWQEVAHLLFAHIKLLKQEGIQQWIFAEQKALNETSFQFAETVSASATAVALAERQQHYPADKLLSGPYRLGEFSAEELSAAFAPLMPDNALVLLTHPNAKTNKTSQYYQTPYAAIQLAGNAVAQWRAPVINELLAIPSPNPFVPTQLAVTPLEREKSTLFSYTPQVVKRTEDLTLWFEQDDEFLTPKTDIHLLIETSVAQQSTDNQMAIELYLNLVSDALNEVRYEAGLAGAGYQLQRTQDGILVRLYGYQDKLPLLLDTLILELVEHQVDGQRFALKRQELIRRLSNQKEDAVLNQTVRQLSQWMTSDAKPLNERIKATKKMSVERMLAVRKNWLAESNLKLMVHGNMTEQQAIGLAERIDAVIPQQGTTAVKRSIAALPTKDFFTELNIDNNDAAFLQYHQGANSSLRERALYTLLAETMSAPYFTELRTREQLGYIVLARAFDFDDYPGLILYVQSPSTDPALIHLYSDRFLNRFEQELANMTDVTFSSYKEGIQNSLKEPAKNLFELSSRYWADINVGNQHFNTEVRLATEIGKISLDGFRRFYKNRILSDESRSIALHQIGKSMKADYAEHSNNIVGFYPLSTSKGWPSDVQWVTPLFNNIEP